MSENKSSTLLTSEVGQFLKKPKEEVENTPQIKAKITAVTEPLNILTVEELVQLTK